MLLIAPIIQLFLFAFINKPLSTMKYPLFSIPVKHITAFLMLSFHDMFNAGKNLRIRQIFGNICLTQRM